MLHEPRERAGVTNLLYPRKLKCITRTTYVKRHGPNPEAPPLSSSPDVPEQSFGGLVLDMLATSWTARRNEQLVAQMLG